MKEELQIRRMEEKDLPAVRDLELKCFSDPWTETMLRDMLESSLDSCFVLLFGEEEGTDETMMRAAAEAAARGIAIAVLVGDEAELMRICVAPEFRGRGWSGPLLEEGMREMRRCGAVSATLEVRAGNIPAIRLYERHGFQKEGLRKKYYRDPVEDAAIYWNRDLAAEDRFY